MDNLKNFFLYLFFNREKLGIGDSEYLLIWNLLKWHVCLWTFETKIF